MKSIFITPFILVLCFAQNSQEYIAVLEKTMFLIFEDDFQSALSTLDSLSIKYADDPTPIVISTIALSSDMRDSEDFRNADSLIRHIEFAESLCIARWGKEPDNPWGAFIYGALIGNRALLNHSLQHGSIISLWRDASRAASLFECAMRDSAAGNEAANGLGNYYYWFSAKAGIMRKIGIVSDRREEGIALLKRSVERGRLSKDLAMHSLVFVLLDSGDTAGAYDAASRLQRRHPNSRTAKWDMLFMEFIMRNRREVIAIADTLLEYYKNKCAFNVCQLCIIAAEAAWELGDTTTSCKYIMQAEEFARRKDIEKKLKRRELWDKFRDIKARCH